VAGLAAGLYTSRVIAERLVGVSPWVLLAPLILACATAGVALALWLARRGVITWPLCATVFYLLWPGTQPTLAALVGLAALVMLAWINHWRLPRWLPVEGLVLVGAFALYIGTLAPGLLPADSGEFQVVCWVLGIAHPPGYALYTMLGRLFTLLPLRNPAWRVNLYGAVCGALTLAVVARTVRRLSDSNAAGVLAAGMLGLATSFWAQSTTANIRSLTALFTALCVASLLQWQRTRAQRDLLLFALCFGLSVGHHASSGLLGLGFLAFLLACEPRIVLAPRRWLPALGVFIASFVVLLYLPIRSAMQPAFDPAPIRTWSDFTSHVLASGFGGDMLYFRTWPELAARLGVWLQIIRLQFGVLLPIAVLLACVPLARGNRRALLLIVAVLVINTLAAVTYRAPQTTEYLIPSYVAWTLLLGCGLGVALRAWPRRQIWAPLLALLTTAVAILAARNYPSFAALHRDDSTRTYADAVLRDAPEGALVLSGWHQATGMWYLQQVEGLRPDVEVVYVYPEGALPNEQVWLRRIDEAISERAVIVTNWFYAYEHTDYRFAPHHDAWQVRAEPLESLPAAATPQADEFEAGIRLLGYELQSDVLAPGETVELRVYWQATQPLERDYSSFAQLLGAQGVVGQGDIVQPASAVLRGEVRVDTYRMPLLLHTPPDEYQLITGFYYTTADGWQRLLADGQDHVALTALRVRAAEQAPATLHSRNDDFANGLRLVGVDYDQSVAGQTRLYLHWIHPARHAPTGAAGPHSATPAVTVQVCSAEQALAQTMVPALAPDRAATVALDVPGTATEVTLRLVSAESAPIARLGPWQRPVGRALTLRLPPGGAHYVPLGGEMAFVGWGNLPAEARFGETLALRPRFLALRPLVRDATVSAGLRQRETGWERKDDGTPALGAIPTLKWVGGWQVEDVRTLDLPDDAPTGALTTVLQVYDAFVLRPLGVLDERLVREGQGTTLTLETLQVQ
jgi:hypothetical protein